VTKTAALAFVRRHGIVLESAHGPVPNLAETVVGAPIRGSWWSHAQGHEIFSLTRAIRDSKDVLVCRLLGGKVTYVHRRLWPALARLQGAFAPHALDAVEEIHTAEGRHVLRTVPFRRWVSPQVQRKARQMSEAGARAALGEWSPQRSRSRRSLTRA